MARCILFLLLMIYTAPALRAQAAGGAAGLEERAEQAFAAADLPQAAFLYQEAAQQAVQPADRARLLVAAGWTHFLANEPDVARARVVAALAADPGFRIVPELLNEAFVAIFYEAQKQAAEQREVEFNAALRQGLEALREKRYQPAREAFTTALDKKPDHPRALYNLALANLQLAKRDEALAGFSKILTLESLKPGTIPADVRALARTNLGRLYIEQHSYEDAEKVLDEAVTLDAGSQAAWTNLGVARRRLGKSGAAAEAFRKAYELAPNDPSAINNLALAYIDARDWVAAVGLLRPATVTFPLNASLWLNLGLSQEGMGNENGAVQSFERAIENDPTNQTGLAASAALRLAKFHHGQRNWSASRQQAERAISWNSSLVAAWVYLGLAQQAGNDLTGARTSLEKARELDPKSPEVHNSLGSVFVDLGLLDLAEPAFQQALVLKPDFPEAKRNLDGLRNARAGGATLPTGRGASAPGSGRPTGTGPTPTVTPPPTHDAGLRFSTIDYSSLGLSGVMVENVLPGTPAARAGIQANDLILRLDGRGVANQAQFRALVAELAGRTVNVDLLRANRPLAVRLALH